MCQRNFNMGIWSTLVLICVMQICLNFSKTQANHQPIPRPEYTQAWLSLPSSLVLPSLLSMGQDPILDPWSHGFLSQQCKCTDCPSISWMQYFSVSRVREEALFNTENLIAPFHTLQEIIYKRKSRLGWRGKRVLMLLQLLQVEFTLNIQKRR